MDGWLNGQKTKYEKNSWMVGWTGKIDNDGWMDIKNVWIDQKNGWMVGWMDKTNRWMVCRKTKL